MRVRDIGDASAARTIRLLLEIPKSRDLLYMSRLLPLCWRYPNQEDSINRSIWRAGMRDRDAADLRYTSKSAGSTSAGRPLFLSFK